MKGKQTIGILGAGTWAMALARMLCNTGKEVTVWSALPKEIDQLQKTNRHPNLQNMQLPNRIGYTLSIEEACTNKDIVVFAVSSIYVRSTAQKAKPYLPKGQIIVDVAKGIEAHSLLTLTEVIADVLKDDTIHYVALSGPTHAEEVAIDLPTTIVSACKEKTIAEYVQTFFTSPFMRVYTNEDIYGIEICGALKNVIALAVGISCGLGFGDNAKAGLITRGLSELALLGGVIGCNPMTFSGLAGMGDMIVTCTSQHSRNNRCGYLLGQGMETQEAIEKVGMVVEGIHAIPAAMELASKHQVEMPIVFAVNAIVNGHIDPMGAVRNLFQRDLKNEMIRFE